MLTYMSDGNSGDTKNYSETLGTRLTPQTMDRFTEYREANELGKTEAARRLIRAGLDANESNTTESIRSLAIWAGTMLIALNIELNFQSLNPDLIVLLGLVLVIGGMLHSRFNT